MAYFIIKSNALNFPCAQHIKHKRIKLCEREWTREHLCKWSRSLQGRQRVNSCVKQMNSSAKNLLCFSVSSSLFTPAGQPCCLFLFLSQLLLLLWNNYITYFAARSVLPFAIFTCIMQVWATLTQNSIIAPNLSNGRKEHAANMQYNNK